MNLPCPSLDSLLNSRRSIRKYRPELPSESLLDQLVHAASLAPSPSDSRPVRFVRVRSEASRSKLCQALENQFHDWLARIDREQLGSRTRNYLNAYYRFSSFIAEAPVLFVVGHLPATDSFSAAMSKAGLLPSTVSTSSPPDIAVGMALMNYSLKAHELGLASCVLTAPLVFLPNLASLLSLEPLVVRALLTTGFPNETPPPKPQRDIVYASEI